MNIKANQHYRTTHKRISDALLELLKEKDLKDITITEICRNLNISRGTFYLHYTDVYDLLDKTERTMSEEMQKRFHDAIEVSAKDAFIEIFRFAKENRTFYGIYLERGKALQVEDELTYEGLDNNMTTLSEKRPELTDTERFYHNAFFRAGLRTLLRCWFSRDCEETPEMLFEILKTQYTYY